MQGFCFCSANFTISPNPSHTNLNIIYNTLQKQELSIYDVIGKVVFKDQWLPNQTEKTIDVSAIPKGVYFLRVGGGVKKVVVE
ncbi:MAG: T9SS type A sorting domain-containing protein [Bacteroidetes bacterium]|nr:T9SS type A sorting domain-containing protein [Bacteroidota bacterium]